MGLRSEKEIREKIEFLKKYLTEPMRLDSKTLKRRDKDYLGKEKDTIFINEYDGGQSEDIIPFLEWVLQGEPRYSVKELEKIAGKGGLTGYFVRYLKEHPEYVKKVLEKE